MMKLISDKIPDLQVSLCSTDELGIVAGRSSSEEIRVNRKLFLNWRIRDVTVINWGTRDSSSTEETRVYSKLFLNWRIRDGTVTQLKKLRNRDGTVP
jgi:hypothetical protein